MKKSCVVTPFNVIVSHQHQFIFFAVPKTATHAVRVALRPLAGADAWEQQMLEGSQSLPVPELAEIQHGHITVKEAAEFLPSDVWQQYRKFAVVRNPFDRFISACAFLTRGSEVFSQAPRRWMKAALQREQFRSRVLIRPQADQLCDDQGLIAMDYLARYENLSESLNNTLGNLGLPEVELPRKNASKHAAWRSYYDDELRQLVTTFYQRDLDCFNYRFED